ncbi:Werner Syndrome-like exonuclease [Telopea speciosissima]|uniref:Werner Syndrome-like exonuclease n=1 Tax=Telopea speciosissima TaxID=54955 RepID=UPI001CC5E49D|nr:Werner Syndrome-like exonuclease [Telopea speciosissima]XP_043725509.1 Werner Syndrome-like exonuclease [Telopea speciosissima]
MASYSVEVGGGVKVQTTVVKTASMVDTFVGELKNLCAGNTKPIIGLDLEWNSNSADPKVAILQLCVGTRCLIIQLRYLNVVPASLKNLISDPAVSFVGVGVTEDVAKLLKDYGIECKNAIELGPLAARVYGKTTEYAKKGLADLALEVVGFHMEKHPNVSCSNWDNETLTNEQIKYATIDAYASYLIGKKLLIG